MHRAFEILFGEKEESKIPEPEAKSLRLFCSVGNTVLHKSAFHLPMRMISLLPAWNKSEKI
ncbi:hypothetical protein DWW59_02525 [Firmicutes bacterium AF16-15]|nr:hypothetical protein DWW59_02525 [Firmicutes bacterium AF16-15]